MASRQPPAPPPTGKITLPWVGLNIIRLAGFAAVLCAVVAQLQLLSSDLAGVKQGLNTRPTPAPVRSGWLVPSYNSSTVASSEPTQILPSSSQSTNSIIPSAPAAAAKQVVTTSSTSTFPTSFPISFIPFSSSSSHSQATVTATTLIVASATTSPAVLPEDRSSRNRKRNVEVAKRDTGESGARYYPSGTVPNIPGGTFFTVAFRLATVIALIVLGAGQLGIPERFLMNHISALDINHTPATLGVGQIFIGLEMQTHYIPIFARATSYALLGIGVFNFLTALTLEIIDAQSRKNKDCHLLTGTTNQKFHQLQRIPFWTPMPAWGPPRRSGDPAFKMADPERPEDPFGDEKSPIGSSDSEASEDEGGYPTFTGRGVEDTQSQVPTVEQDGEGYIMRLSKDPPKAKRVPIKFGKSPRRGPPQPVSAHRGDIQSMAGSITSLPSSLQGIINGRQPRFAQDADIPVISVQSPSTIASSRISHRFPRPDTAYSGTSGVSTASSLVRQDSARSGLHLIEEMAPAFPHPPASVPKARARTRYDINHLRPPPPGPAPRGPPPEPRPALSRSVSETRPNTRSVRFELERNSVDVEAGLEEFLPEKGHRRANSDGKVRARSGSDDVTGIADGPLSVRLERSNSDFSVTSGISEASSSGSSESHRQFLQPPPRRPPASSEVFHDAIEDLTPPHPGGPGRRSVVSYIPEDERSEAGSARSSSSSFDSSVPKPRMYHKVV